MESEPFPIEDSPEPSEDALFVLSLETQLIAEAVLSADGAEPILSADARS